MSKLIEKVISYKANPKDEILKDIFDILAPMKVPINYREDLTQEIKFCFFKLIKCLNINNSYIEKDLFTKINYDYLKANFFSNFSLNNIFNNKY